DGTEFSVDSRYYSAAKKKLSPKGITVTLGGGYQSFFDKAKERGYKKVGIDFTKVTVYDFEYFKTSGLDFVDISGEIREITAKKTERELSYIQKACRIAEKSWKETLNFIEEGVTETDVANELEYRFKKNGASGPSFDTIVAFGKNAAVPHHETGNTKLKRDQCVLMDFGCLYKGYCSDMTRTMFYGKPSDEFIKAYSAVWLAHEEAARFIKDGVSGTDADAIARKVLEERGYGKYFTHSLGHGIGVNIHEYPNLSPRSEWTLENNMVFSNEPGVYIDGKFGIRIEDSACLSGGEYKSFMKDDKKLILLGDGKIRKLKTF
ncbi:MAG TPA: peptidase M24 family protein, partial [Clostridiales bacterium]|nr:peptidase M24 family protein [Clostridiales bacterium]